MIDGVRIKQLKPIPDERGRVMEMLRSDDALFKQFGYVYMTSAYPGVVKGWHYHEKQTDHFVVVKGMMKVVLYDDRADSPSRGEVNEFFMGDYNQILLQIPPGVFHGFKCISSEEAIVVNTPDQLYDPSDEHRVPAHDNEIPYDWARKDR